MPTNCLQLARQLNKLSPLNIAMDIIFGWKVFHTVFQHDDVGVSDRSI